MDMIMEVIRGIGQSVPNLLDRVSDLLLPAKVDLHLPEFVCRKHVCVSLVEDQIGTEPAAIIIQIVSNSFI